MAKHGKRIVKSYSNLDRMKSYAVKDAVTFVAALALMALAGRFARHHVHALCLTLGGVGLLAVGTRPSHRAPVPRPWRQGSPPPGGCPPGESVDAPRRR